MKSTAAAAACARSPAAHAANAAQMEMLQPTLMQTACSAPHACPQVFPAWVDCEGKQLVDELHAAVQVHRGLLPCRAGTNRASGTACIIGDAGVSSHRAAGTEHHQAACSMPYSHHLLPSSPASCGEQSFWHTAIVVKCYPCRRQCFRHCLLRSV